MRVEALSLIHDLSDPAGKLNILREYVQAQVLRSLHESEAFRSLSFVGGTALRFVYGLPRFSEDLGLSLDDNVEEYQPECWLKKMKRDLSLAGFDVSLSWNNRTTVHKAWVKIPGILKQAGLASMENQNLSIKLEIDTHPPKGAVSERKIITKYTMFSLKHYNLPSLMAGKLHALLTRKYHKGRDWYDLMWYRTQVPPIDPNLVQLQNALNQTQGRGTLEAALWKQIIIEVLHQLDCSVLRADVQAFLERPRESDLLTHENIASVLL